MIAPPISAGLESVAHLLDRLGDRQLRSLTRTVDDCVPGDGEEPGRSGPSIGFVALRRAPDRGEGILRGILGAPVVSEQPDG